MPRLSQRLQAKQTAVPDEPEMQLNEVDIDDDDDVQRPRKRAKKASSSSAGSRKKQFKNVRGKRALLEKLAKDVPLDVIFEIFCYLEPGDLLRLARSSTDLRGILMSKSSESIWRTSRSNIEGLPPLPEDLNEPQYAHLLFESYCHLCMHKGRCENVLWQFRIRCCKNCMTDEAIFPEHISFCDANTLTSRIVSIVPFECVKLGNRRSDIYITYTPLADAIQNEYKGLEGDGARTEWSTRMAEKRRRVKDHARLCQIWHESRLSHRADELSEVRSQRKAAILDRLEQMGWREEAEIIIEKSSKHGHWDEFADHKLVRQSKKLTDYGWNSIKAELVKYLSEHKKDRLVEERRTIIASRYDRLAKLYYELRSTMDVREPFPAMGDLLLSKVIENLVWNTPVDQELADDVLSSTLSQYLSDMITGWRSKTELELLGILQQAIPTATASDLRLATTVFECQFGCCSPMQYPDMFYHRCCVSIRLPTTSENAEVMRIYNRGTLTKGPWQPRLRYDASASQLTSKIVKACDLNPSRATVQDLYAANPLIECVDCNYASEMSWGGRLFMRWPLPLSHSIKGHNLLTDSFGEDTERIRAAEPAESLTGRSNTESVHCAHCHKLHTRLSLILHLKDAHEITLDSLTLETKEEHWYWSPLCKAGDIRESFRYRAPEPPAAASEQ